MLLTISYKLDKKPQRIVVTDLSDERIKRAQEVLSEKQAKERGIELIYHNPNNYAKSTDVLKEYTNGHGYDDAFVYVPVSALVEEADSLLAFDGCLNFFAGPTDNTLSAKVNIYNIHYINTKIMGSTGGNNDDLIEALELSSKKRINPSVMVTHIGGIDAIAKTSLTLPNIPGGKKLMYTHINMPLTAIEDFEELGKNNPLFKKLYQAVSVTNGLWNAKAEQILLDYYKV